MEHLAIDDRRRGPCPWQALDPLPIADALVASSQSRFLVVVRFRACRVGIRRHLAAVAMVNPGDPAVVRMVLAPRAEEPPKHDRGVPRRSSQGMENDPGAAGNIT